MVFLVSGDPEPLLGAIQVAKEIINNNKLYLEFV
jgi:hypothetical protein